MSPGRAHDELERLSGIAPTDRAEPSPKTFTEQDLLALIDELHALVMTDLDRALAHGDALVWIADRVGADVPRVRARVALAHALSYANRFEEAIETLDAAESLAEHAGHTAEAARTKVARVQPLARQGHLAEALACCESAADAFAKADDRVMLVKATTNRAVLLRMLGRRSEAVEAFDRVLQIADDDAIRAQIESNRAEALLELGRFAEAESGFRTAAEHLESVGMKRVAAIVRGNLADLLGRQGRLSEATTQFEAARRFFEQDDAPGDLARLEAELADVLAAVGLSDEAVRIFERAIVGLANAGMKAELARAKAGLGAALAEAESDRADQALAEAEEIYRKLDHAAGVAIATLHRARLAVSGGDRARAGRLLSKLDERDLPPVAQIQRRSLLALLALDNAARHEAAGHLQQAFEMANSYAVPAVTADLFSLRARLHSANGQREDASADHRRAVDELERLRGSFRAPHLRSAWLGARKGVSTEAVRDFLDAGGPGVREAFEIHERARARSLLDQIRGGVDVVRRARPGDADDSLQQRLTEARRRLNLLYTQLDPTRGTGGPHDLAAWHASVRESERAIADLEARLAITGDHAATPMGVTAAETIAALRPGDRYLSYALLGDELVCFCVADGAVSCARGLATADELDELVAGAAFQLRRGIVRDGADGPRARRRADAATAALARLHDTVLGPIADRLDGPDRLIVAPVGPLHLIPFGAMHDGRRFLIERCSVRRVLGAGMLAGAPDPVTESRALVMGIEDAAAPGMVEEARAVAEILGTRALVNAEESTADRLISAAGGAAIVHVCCHGVFIAGDPLASALKLSDRWLTVRDTFGLDLRGATVVLSGCDTGRIEADRADEIQGFLRGFLGAGASVVVSSLWKAQDRTTKELMKDSYRGMQAAGGTLSAGLRAAQADRAARGVHPGLWAGFVQYGVSR